MCCTGRGEGGGGDERSWDEERLLLRSIIGASGGLVVRVIVSRAGECMRDRLDRLPCLYYPEDWRRSVRDFGLVIRGSGRWDKCG